MSFHGQRAKTLAPTHGSQTMRCCTSVRGSRVSAYKPTSTCGTSVNITFACKSPEHIVRFMAKLTAGRSSSGLKRVLKHSTHVRRNRAALLSNERDGVCGCSLRRGALSGRHLWRLLWCASLRANASSTKLGHCCPPKGGFLKPPMVSLKEKD